jgi:hypothetical protein
LADKQEEEEEEDRKKNVKTEVKVKKLSPPRSPRTVAREILWPDLGAAAQVCGTFTRAFSDTSIGCFITGARPVTRSGREKSVDVIQPAGIVVVDVI